MAAYQVTAVGSILRVADGAFIPSDPTNNDRAEFERWVAAGNAPDPYIAPAPNASVAREQAFVADTERQTLIAQIMGATPDQIRTFVNANVTDLASAKVLLRKLVLVIAILVQK